MQRYTFIQVNIFCFYPDIANKIIEYMMNEYKEKTSPLIYTTKISKMKTRLYIFLIQLQKSSDEVTTDIKTLLVDNLIKFTNFNIEHPCEHIFSK